MTNGAIRPFVQNLFTGMVALGCLLPTIGAAQQLLSPFAKRKARALLADRLPCLGCHRLGSDGGTIGPDFDSVFRRRSAAYIRAIVTDPQRVVPGTAMPRTAMPAGTRELVIRFLAEGAALGTGPESQAALRTDSPASGYSRYCAACHGAAGRGDGPNAGNLPVPPADHTDGQRLGARPDDYLYDMIATGGSPMGRSPRMPAFGETLSPDEIRGLVGYLRTLCHCAEPAWAGPNAPRR